MIFAKTDDLKQAQGFSLSLFDGRIVIPTEIIILLFFGSHILMGPIIRNAPILATAHAGIVMLIGIGLALKKAPLAYIAYICAYIVGAEVLWRMSQASIPWEIGKYDLHIISATVGKNTYFTVDLLCSFASIDASFS